MEASISLDKLLQFSLNANDKRWLGERSIEETEKETEAKDSEFTGKKEVLPGIDTGM